MEKLSQTKTSLVILPKLPEKPPSLSNYRGIGEKNSNELKKSDIFGQIESFCARGQLLGAILRYNDPFISS